jgi:hypothetical protein
MEWWSNVQVEHEVMSLKGNKQWAASGSAFLFQFSNTPTLQYSSLSFPGVHL